jgi:hypothetical protein
MHPQCRRAPSPIQLGFTRVGHLKLSKSDISDFDWERVGVRGYDLSMDCQPSPGSHLRCDPTSPFGRGEGCSSLVRDRFVSRCWCLKPRQCQRAPSPIQLGFTQVGHLKLSKSDISDFDRERVGVRGYDLSLGRNPSSGAMRRPLPLGEVKRERGNTGCLEPRRPLIPAYFSPALNGGSLPGGTVSSAIASIMATMT